MKRMKHRGAVFTDYAMLTGLVSVVAISVIITQGEQVAETFCKGSNGLATASGGEMQAWCMEDKNASYDLGEDERFVDAPFEMQGDFADITFAQGELGERLVLTEVAEPAAESFWLDTAITSRDAFEPEREISSCYTVGGGVDPICSQPGSEAAISVPPEAEAYGYLVTLGDDPDMPWANDVAISIPSVPLNWDVVVGREEAEPTQEAVSFAFGPQVFAAHESGWTYGPFTEISGKFNRDLRLEIERSVGTIAEREACYMATPEGAPDCGTASNYAADVRVPAGASHLGYRIKLPEPDVGPDWTRQEVFTLKQGEDVLHQETVSITRQNPGYQTGSAEGSFSDPYTFAQTDTGWTDGEFIALSGEHNDSLTLSMVKVSGPNYERAACYRMEAGGVAECNTVFSNSEVTWAVPVGAVEIGYRVNLWAESVGADWTTRERIKLTHAGSNTTILDQEVTMIRPNEPYQVGSAEGSFTDPYSFAQTDTGWTYGEFIALSGEHNDNLTLSMAKVSGPNYERAACYRMEIGGAAECTSSYSNSTATRSVPVGAVEVGYRVNLSAEGVGADWTTRERIKLTHAGSNTTILDQEVTMIRPNEPYQVGSAEGSFSDPYSFAQTDTGWTHGEYLTLSGTHNDPLTLTMNKVSGPFYQRSACYRMEIGGTAECKTAFSNSQVTWAIPVGAVEIGYRVNLSAEGVGADWTTRERIKLTHAGSNTTILDQEVTMIRPNEPYEVGSVEGSFSDPYTYAQTDTGWTHGEYLTLSGTHNHPLTLTMNQVSGPFYQRSVCYRMQAGGTAECSTSYSSSAVSKSIPVGAVEVGYRFSLPGETVGPDWTTRERIKLHGASNMTVLEQEVTVVRPNEPYQMGGVATNFTDPYAFAADATGWTYGEFVELTGPRNGDLQIFLDSTGGPDRERQACYTLEVGGTPQCGPSKYASSSIDAGSLVPVEAVEVGYRVRLPGVSSGSWSASEEILVRFKANNQTLHLQEVTMTRPASE